MKKRALPTVTLLGIDCIDIKRLVLAAEICQKHFEFAETKLLTSLPARGEKNVVRIKPITSVEAYSRFIVRDLYKYVNTPHVLLIQYDGFVLNPRAWTDDYLKYDYIGAPWLVADFSIKKHGFPKDSLGKLLVGNGGFSLRSRRFLEESAKLARRGGFKYHPEDVALCIWNGKRLERRGMKFAPVSVAARFSFESAYRRHRAWNGQFGFHDLRVDISKWLKRHPQYRHRLMVERERRMRRGHSLKRK